MDNKVEAIYRLLKNDYTTLKLLAHDLSVELYDLFMYGYFKTEIIEDYEKDAGDSEKIILSMIKGEKEKELSHDTYLDTYDTYLETAFASLIKNGIIKIDFNPNKPIVEKKMRKKDFLKKMNSILEIPVDPSDVTEFTSNSILLKMNKYFLILEDYHIEAMIDGYWYKMSLTVKINKPVLEKLRKEWRPFLAYLMLTHNIKLLTKEV